MAWHDFLDKALNYRPMVQMPNRPPVGSYAATNANAHATWKATMDMLAKNDNPHARMIKDVLEQRAPARSLGLPDIGFKGVRQQLFQRFNLIDLYAIAYNNSTIATATGALKQEVFRRGLEWEPAFLYRDRESGVNYEIEDLLRLSKENPAAFKVLKTRLETPDPAQRMRFEELMQRVNIYDQSLITVFKMIEDDLNIADDGFLFLSSDYGLRWNGDQEEIVREIRQIYRLDPIFVEFDTDEQNRVGFAHHICLLHREDLLEIPPDEGWEFEWQGYCPKDGHTTFPVLYRYMPYRGTFGVKGGKKGPDQQALYLVKGEIIHASKYVPSELYGYSPVLSIYEKALTLIGMDRYLYDYFFERKVPQGVITTTTDNPEDLETRKEQMLAEVLNDPHYIPWLAVSSKLGHGKTEFVRFAFSLDELQFLPVQEGIARDVASMYGVPNLFMGDTEGVGGLNNETQQITRMSRGAARSQDVYNTEILPALLDAFGITDWILKIRSSEERTEKFELDLKSQKVQIASTMVTMGFGARYSQDDDEFEFFGEILPRAEQEAAQQQAWGGGGMDFGGGAEEEEEEAEPSRFDFRPTSQVAEFTDDILS